MTQVNFLLNMILESPLILEKVKKVKVGRRRREGCWVMMILTERLLFRLRVEKMASTYWGANRRNIDRTRSAVELPLCETN